MSTNFVTYLKAINNKVVAGCSTRDYPKSYFVSSVKWCHVVCHDAMFNLVGDNVQNK